MCVRAGVHVCVCSVMHFCLVCVLNNFCLNVSFWLMVKATVLTVFLFHFVRQFRDFLYYTFRTFVLLQSLKLFIKLFSDKMKQNKTTYPYIKQSWAFPFLVGDKGFHYPFIIFLFLLFQYFVEVIPIKAITYIPWLLLTR
jgi:hypothetical protein